MLTAVSWYRVRRAIIPPTLRKDFARRWLTLPASAYYSISTYIDTNTKMFYHMS